MPFWKPSQVGTRLKLAGELVCVFEHCALHEPGAGDWTVLGADSLWIEWQSGEEPVSPFLACVVIEGVLSIGPAGHLGLWSGRLQEARIHDILAPTPGFAARRLSFRR